MTVTLVGLQVFAICAAKIFVAGLSSLELNEIARFAFILKLHALRER